MSAPPPGPYGLPGFVRSNHGLGCGCVLGLSVVALMVIVYAVGFHFVAGLSLWVSAAISVFTIALTWYLSLRLWRSLTTTRVWMCPHCGAQTRPDFRICGTCGRVK